MACAYETCKREYHAKCRVVHYLQYQVGASITYSEYSLLWPSGWTYEESHPQRVPFDVFLKSLSWIKGGDLVVMGDPPDMARYTCILFVVPAKDVWKFQLKLCSGPAGGYQRDRLDRLLGCNAKE